MNRAVANMQATKTTIAQTATVKVAARAVERSSINNSPTAAAVKLAALMVSHPEERKVTQCGSPLLPLLFFLSVWRSGFFRMFLIASFLKKRQDTHTVTVLESYLN